MIPFDKRKPMDPSGIRLGAPALTTRGMKQAAFQQIGRWIAQALETPDDANRLSALRSDVREFARDYPVPADRAAGVQAGKS
jgi:glycine hydroxymethyltransferase